MVIFFFVVGLEIKRELLIGHLSSLKKAMLPVMAAFGGMIVPAVIYAILNAGGEGSRGWGVPMATDIAFSLGMLAVLGQARADCAESLSDGGRDCRRSWRRRGDRPVLHRDDPPRLAAGRAGVSWPSCI